MNRIVISGIIGGMAVVAIVAAFALQQPTQEPTPVVNEINPKNIIDEREQKVSESIELEKEILGPPTELEKEQLELSPSQQEYSDQQRIEKQFGEDYSSRDRDWQTSGPFQIDRTQYLLGENIFLRIGGLLPTDKGQVAFLRPLNETHYSVYMTIPFDGSEKFTFNQYFKPDISISSGVCDKEDIIGRWSVVFQGTSYENLYFEIIDAYLSGEKNNYLRKVC